MSTLKVDTIQNSVGENLVFENKNLLINGGQNIWQRSTSESVNTDTFSTVDRWKTRVSGMGTFTISRSTDVPSGQGFGYSTKWDCTTADASPAAGDVLIFDQRLEGQNLQHLLKGTSSAKKLTLSFWVKSNKTGTYICELFDYDNSRHINKSYTISSASTWEKKELTFDGDTTGTLDNDNALSFLVSFFLGAGSNYTSGTLQTSWGTDTTANRAVGQVNLADSTSNELYITGVQLEVGSKATDFEFEPFEKTLRKCQRYCIVYQGASGGDRVTQAQAEGTGGAIAFFQVPTPLRALPSVTFTSMNLRGGATNYAISSVSSIRPDTDNINHVSCSCNTSGLTSTRSYQLRFDTSSASVKLASEL